MSVKSQTILSKFLKCLINPNYTRPMSKLSITRDSQNRHNAIPLNPSTKFPSKLQLNSHQKPSKVLKKCQKKKLKMFLKKVKKKKIKLKKPPKTTKNGQKPLKRSKTTKNSQNHEKCTIVPVSVNDPLT